MTVINSSILLVLTIIIPVVIVILLMIIGYQIHSVHKWRSLYYSEQKQGLKNKNKLSMVEYNYRMYVEDKMNPYTVLRNMLFLIQEDQEN